MKKDFSDKYEFDIKHKYNKKLSSLTECSRFLDEVLNKKPNKQYGLCWSASAFSHKGGLHVSAVKKDPKTYEHVRPQRSW